MDRGHLGHWRRWRLCRAGVHWAFSCACKLLSNRRCCVAAAGPSTRHEVGSLSSTTRDIISAPVTAEAAILEYIAGHVVWAPAPQVITAVNDEDDEIDWAALIAEDE